MMSAQSIRSGMPGSLLLAYLATAAVLMCGGCDLREPAATPPADPAPSVPGPAAVSAQPAAPVDTGADASAAALKAGREWAVEHIVSKQEPYQPVAPLSDDRFLLHPGEKERSRLVLDISGLEALTLSPRIEDFEGNATCMADPAAGVATLYWSLDDGAKTAVAVDRNFHDMVQIETQGGGRLTLEGDNGNGVIWCDWLAVGFLAIRSR